MKFPAFTLLMAGALLSAPCRAQDFTETVKSILAKTEDAKPLAVQGADKNWYFLRKELVHLSNGDLSSADLSKANVEGTDPLPVIVKYKDDLKALGVDLLLVPVPPKAMIYPEKLSDKIDAKTVPSMTGFFAKLKAAGVEVLDLETAFKNERAQHPAQQLYCATDSHWSPYSCQLAAKLVAEKYKNLPVLKATALPGLTTLKEEPLQFQGDLLEDAQRTSVPAETLPIWRAGKANGSQVDTVESNPDSALLVIGDSHLQVFRKGGNMLATQGGFVDHLQADLGAAVHEITMQAGGADGPRVEIARATAKDPDFWAKKKAVIWVFTAREFTQGKWRMLPAKVQKQK